MTASERDTPSGDWGRACQHRSYRGDLRGRRIYVKPLGRDGLWHPLVFAVYATVTPGWRNQPGPLTLVLRVEDRPYIGDRLFDTKSRTFVRPGRALTARERADSEAAWWRERGLEAEVVALMPVTRIPEPR